MSTNDYRRRLEYLRQQIRDESISYGELIELQSLADVIEPGDLELLQWAGVPVVRVTAPPESCGETDSPPHRHTPAVQPK